MKRCAKVVSVDGPYRMVVTVSFQSKNGLTRAEVDRVAREMARKVADKVREVPYADFGAENTQVKM